MSRRDIEDKVLRDLEPLVAGLGAELLDIELTHENRVTVLRATIYKRQGITLDDCASVQKVISDRLDETDPVPGSYTLEVSSPGLERSLRRDKEFVIFKGMPVKVNLYAPVGGKRTFEGDLTGLVEEPSGVKSVAVKTSEGEVQLGRSNVSKVSLVYRERKRDL